MRRRLWQLLLSTGPKFGLTIGCFGLASFLLAGAEVIAAKVVPLGYLVAFMGFSWAALTAYVKHPGLRGGGIAMTVLLVLALPEYYDADPIRFCVAWGLLYMGAITIGLAALCRTETERADHWIKILKEERAENGRDPHTGQRL